jgi:chromosomal replication initiation ATPase DnaA
VRVSVVSRTIEAASQACGVTRREIASPTRTQGVADARAIVAWLLVRAFGMSLPRAGLYLSRHHTTVLHAVGRVDDAIREFGPLREHLVDTIDIMVDHSLDVLSRGTVPGRPEMTCAP